MSSLLLLLLLLYAPISSFAVSHKNVLLIIADDLRFAPIFPAKDAAPLAGGVYKAAPNLERLKAAGVTFERAFTNVPWCGPSRASFLTGREPLETKAYSVNGQFRLNAVADAWRTIPQFFLDRGYKTYGAGKVFHLGSTDDQSPEDWSEIIARNVPQGVGYLLGNCQPKVIPTRANASWVRFYDDGIWNPAPVGQMIMCRSKDPIDMFDDFVIAHAAVDKLTQIAADPHPFFMALGFYRPHEPYHVHDTFWAKHLNDLDQVPDPTYINGPVPRHDMPPNFAVQPDSIEAGVQVGAFPMVYMGICNWRLRRAMRVGYAAALSQMDAALGLVLDALQSTGLDSSTAIVFYGDHGFHLGESSLWYKKLLTDFATHVPLIASVPWMNVQRGAHVTATYVELLDVYRTLATITGFADLVDKGIDGKSFDAWLVNPSAPGGADGAMSVIARCPGRQCRGLAISSLGFSIRTEAWRYNVWVETPHHNVPNWTRIDGEELYNHTQATSFEDHFNLQHEPQFATVKQALFAKIKARYDKVF